MSARKRERLTGACGRAAIGYVKTSPSHISTRAERPHPREARFAVKWLVRMGLR